MPCTDLLNYNPETRQNTPESLADYNLCLKIEEVKAGYINGDISIRNDFQYTVQNTSDNLWLRTQQSLANVQQTMFDTFAGFTNYLKGRVETEEKARAAGDLQNSNFANMLHNQQQMLIELRTSESRQYTDTMIHAQTVAFSSQLSASISPLTLSVNRHENAITSITNKIKSFLDDPVGWILGVFSAVLVTFLSEELAELIAPDTTQLPARSDYKKIVSDSLIQ